MILEEQDGIYQKWKKGLKRTYCYTVEDFKRTSVYKDPIDLQIGNLESLNLNPET